MANGKQAAVGGMVGLLLIGSIIRTAFVAFQNADRAEQRDREMIEKLERMSVPATQPHLRGYEELLADPEWRRIMAEADELRRKEEHDAAMRELAPTTAPYGTTKPSMP
jgi:hypothetical protein